MKNPIRFNQLKLGKKLTGFGKHGTKAIVIKNSFYPAENRLDLGLVFF